MKQVFLHRMGALLLALILTLSLALPTMATSAPGTSPDQTENTEGDGNTDGSGEDDKDDGDDGSGDGNEDNDNKPVAVEGVDISLRAAAIDIGESTEPIIDFSPSFATNQEYTLTSSDTSVATITEGNKITGVSPGEAAITVTTADGAKTATTKIEVSGFILKANDNILAKSGGDGKGELAMELGRSQTLVCTTYGKAKDYVEFIWQSEDRMVVYAIGTGTTCQITARSVGSTAVILTAGGKEAKFTVKVSDSSALEGGTITAGTPYKPSTMLAEIRKNCPDTLSYISNLSVSPNQGVLYYGYKTPADTGFGVGNEKYYITKTTGQRNFSDVTFVPRAEFSGTATITYMAFNTRGESVGGSIRLTIKAIDDVSYTTLKDTPLVFQGGDFNTICRVRTGHELSYVTFTLPAASQGVLYYNYTGEAAYAEKVIDGTQYFRSRSPYLDSITFLPASGFTGSVRIDYRAVDTSGLAYNGRATINVGTGNGSTTSPEEGDVNYRAAAGDPVDFRASDFNDACWEALDGTLDYIKFTEISSDQGELRYNYRSSANPGSQVSESTRYYRNDSPSISNITFVPSSDHTEAVTLKFTGYGVGGERFEGTVVIDYTGKAGGGNISYTVRAGRPAEFETADFNELCQNKLGNSLDYVCFDDLPSSSRGTLYRNYTSSGSGTRVDEDDRISRTNLSRVAFVPNRSYSGTVDIGFTGYDTKGNSFSGTVTIQVDDSGASEGISYSTRPGGSVLFNASDFNDMCREVTGASLNYVRFELPASSRGTLYYKYDSDKPAEVKESTSYYRSGSGRLLDDITFVSNSNFAGTVEISYTGYSSGSGQFSGSVLITVAAPRAETIYLTAGSAPIQLSSAAFRQACGTVLTQGLSYVRFTSLPDTRAGRLYENYMDAASGYQASTGSPYYLTGSPGIDQLTFVPQSGYQGTATINYTGYGAGGDQVSGTVEIAVSNGGSGGINIPAVSSFSDMANYSWATAAVEYLSQTGVVNGIGNGRFGPEQTIQRCDFTLMLCRAFRFDMIGGNSFPDIPAGSYYGSAVTTAKSLGIVTGSNGLFMPTSALSRQDAMLMLKRAMVAAGWSVPSGAEGSLSRFSDGAQVSGYARDAVASMVQMGVVTGDGANRLKPWEPISRAEMAVILYRVLAR
ncbi:MAG: hypothetical protein HFF30_00560 [Flavonifractor sp.]|nr:hypothetical protein [Flavonifractor sp.]